ncbi:hypothetical protein BMS3Abin04_00434 [bacterium BMS3Abin04]|nr:hypothetical protein BMS3Abin04_00434 [bacterium BMS3Abin04]
MFMQNYTYSQVSFDLFGNMPNFSEAGFRINTLEGNPVNFSRTKDWEFSMSLNSNLTSKITNDLFQASLAKRFKNHYIYARYSPGIIKDFDFTKTESKVDDSLQTYVTRLNYQEKYGFGYSYNVFRNLTAGFSFRYFQQNFSEEFPEFIADTNRLVINKQTESVQKNFWKGDIGIEYSPLSNLNLSLSSLNLFILGENFSDDAKSDFEIKTNHFNIRTKKGAILGVSYFPVEKLNLKFNYETSNSFIAGISTGFNLWGKDISVGLSVLHDAFQEPTIAAVSPSINYSNSIFSVTFSAIKYLSNRNKPKSLTTFRNYGVHSITNNYFINDQAYLSFNLALSFIPEKSVKFLDVKILREIYPTLADDYLTKPFAIAKVVNLSDKTISVKPTSMISEVNKEEIQSPEVTIPAKDTVDIPFYTILNDNLVVQRRKIEQVNFNLITSNNDPDDKIQRPILVNDIHSWDGNVRDLKYFVQRDYNFSSNFSKMILQNYRDSLRTKNPYLRNFYRIKYLFNTLADKMQYVADRRGSYDNVQFPSETIELKGGDCDDLSVIFSSLLESIGIQTAFVDYKPDNDNDIGHVNLLINTELKPNQAQLITSNDKKIFIRKNADGKEQVWIPLEVTSLTNFETAWKIGADEFNKKALEKFGLAKGKVAIDDLY